MRKVRHLLIAAAALLLGAQTAGATDWSGTYRGLAKDKATSSTKLYLYNQGTGKFLTTGGHWGTEAEVGDLGTALKFTDSKFKAYEQTQEWYLGYSTGGGTADDKGIYIDGGEGSGDTFALNLVSGTKATYTLSNSRGYLSVTGGSGADANTVTYAQTSSANAQWKLIPQDSLIAEFEKAQADYDNPADASFYIQQPDFMRQSQATQDSYIWSCSAWDSNLTPGKEIDSPLKYGNSLYYYPNSYTAKTTTYTYTYTCDTHTYHAKWSTNTCNNTTVTTNDDHGDSWTTTCSSCRTEVTYKKTNTSSSTSTSNKDNGWFVEGSDKYNPTEGYDVNSVDGWTYNVTQDEIDNKFTNLTEVLTGEKGRSAYNAVYGKYFCGRIIGNGYIQQTITVAKAGTYRLACEGFISGTGTAKLSANGEGMSIKTGTYTTQTQAAIDLYNGKYHNEVVFEVPEGKLSVTIMLQITDGEGAYTCFDKFRLYFLGEEKKTANLLVLDDRQTASYEYFTDTKGLGADNTDVLTLYLRHSGLKATGKWTSIILPVSMSQNQLQAVFGNDVKVAKLDCLDNTINGSTDSNNKIWFKSVTTGIEANVPYIIKPSELKTTENPEVEGYVGNRTDESEDKDSYKWNLASGDHAGEYFVIPLVKLNKTSITPTTVTTDERAGVKVSMTGGYITRKVDVKDDNVLFGFGGGNLYYYQNKEISFKPFRCWLLESAVTNEAKQLSFSIDGIEDIDAQGVTTMIDDILSDATDGNRFTSDTVYNINGQKVRTAVTSLEGLPKGLYIVNGKKYVVK